MGTDDRSRKVASMVISYLSSLTVGVGISPSEPIEIVFDVLDAIIDAWSAHPQFDQESRDRLEARCEQFLRRHMLRQRRSYHVLSLAVEETPEAGFQLVSSVQFSGEDGVDHTAIIPLFITQGYAEDDFFRYLFALKLFTADLLQLKDENRLTALARYVREMPTVTGIMEVKPGGREAIPYRLTYPEGSDEDNLEEKRKEIGLPSFEKGFAREKIRIRELRKKRKAEDELPSDD